MSILLVIEIIVVIVAFAILVMVAVKTARKAAALGRTAQQAQEHLEPKIERLSRQGERTSTLGVDISERMELLESRGEVLTATMGKMGTLVSAAAEAKSKLDNAKGYIGL